MRSSGSWPAGQGGDAQVEVDVGGDGLGAALGGAHRLGGLEVEEQGAGALGGGHARAVGVHGEHDARGEAREPGGVALGEGGAHRRDEVAEARLPRPDHVEVALDDDDGAALAGGGTGEIEAVEGAALIEDLGLGGVEVLRLALAEDAPAEADEHAAVVGDGDDDAAAEAVVGRAARLVLVEDAGGEGVLVAVAAAEQVVAEQAPLVGGPAEMEALDRLGVQAAFRGQVVAGLGAALTRELLLVKVDGGGDDAAEALGARALLGGAGGELDAGFLGEDAQGLAEVDILAFLDEGEDVAALAAAAEAAPGAAIGEDVERGGLLGVEGAEGAQVAARLLQLDGAAYVLGGIDSPLDFGDGVHAGILLLLGLLGLLRFFRLDRGALRGLALGVLPVRGDIHDVGVGHAGGRHVDAVDEEGDADGLARSRGGDAADRGRLVCRGWRAARSSASSSPPGTLTTRRASLVDSAWPSFWMTTESIPPVTVARMERTGPSGGGTMMNSVTLLSSFVSAIASSGSSVTVTVVCSVMGGLMVKLTAAAPFGSMATVRTCSGDSRARLPGERRPVPSRGWWRRW